MSKRSPKITEDNEVAHPMVETIGGRKVPRTATTSDLKTIDQKADLADAEEAERRLVDANDHIRPFKRVALTLPRDAGCVYVDAHKSPAPA